MQIYSHIQMHPKMQVDSNTQATLLFRYEPFINFWLWFFDTRRETILTMLTVLSDPTNAQHILSCLRSRPTEISKTPTTYLDGREFNSLCPYDRHSTVCHHGPNLKSSTAWSDPNFSTPWSELNWIFFKIFQILSPSLLGMTSSTFQPIFLNSLNEPNSSKPNQTDKI